MYTGQTEIREAYQDLDVAQKYVARRFESPLGALLHARQSRSLRKLIQREGIRRAAEIAPGPARLTVETAPFLESVTLVDASAEMLDTARRRLAERGLQGRTRFVRGDAFHLPLATRFPLVYSFRLIRHFAREDRLRLYRELAGVLEPRGWLVFDAVNHDVSARVRARAGAGEYEHFDALLRPDELAGELREAGLDLVSLTGVQRRYPALQLCQIYVAPRSGTLARGVMEVIDRLGGEPLEWIVQCRRA